MNRNKVGLVLGSFAALIHLVWELLVAFGLAQGLIDFAYRMHSLNNPFRVMSFDLTKAVGLVIYTFVMGYILGYVFSWVWNKFHR